MRDLLIWQKQEYTGMKPGLARMRRFLKLTGNPQETLSVVQVAGTNGKGSTARMLAGVLEKAGYRTGLYTSPHLLSINERIQVNSRPIAGDELNRLARTYGRVAEQCGLSFFEFITGLAFIHFSRNKIDIAVLETGMGGKYDATNVVRSPRISIITDVDFDHRQFLGNSLAAIAGEKAGIIKRGCPVISGVERPAAAPVVRLESREKHSPLYELSRDFKFERIRTEWQRGIQEIQYRGLDEEYMVRLPLLGNHQAKNCSLVLASVEILRRRGFHIGSNNVRAAMRDVSWPGRFDVRRIRHGNERTTVVLDGAHNPGAMRQFVKTWKESPFGKEGMSLIFGVLKDKEYGTVVREIAPVVKSVVLVPPQSPRALSADVMAQTWEKHISRGNIARASSFADALAILRNTQSVAVTGSLYLVGEALRYIKHH